MASLPPTDILFFSTPNHDALSNALTILFETTPPINDSFVPMVARKLPEAATTAPSYQDVIDISLEVVRGWDHKVQAQFIECHPRIGQVNKLSHLSSNEQAAAETPPEVIARLEHLNACYEYRYPGLRYITFVNKRTRAEIMEEMEDKLGIVRSLSPNEPEVESVGRVLAGSDEWLVELERAVQDIGKIAKARLKTLESGDSSA